MPTSKKPEDYQLSNLEAQDYFKKEILPELKESYDFSEKMQPKAYFTGGLPGAGKSKIVEQLEKENPKIPIIDVDDLRKHHPNSDIIQKHFGESASSITHPDAVKFAYLFKKEIFENRADYVLDSTLRNPKSAQFELGQALNHGYDVRVTLVAVHEFESLQGTLSRYARQLERNPTEARFVDYNFIKEGASSIADSVELIDKLPVNEFKIVTRDQNIIYDKGSHTIDARSALEKYNDPKNWDKSRVDDLKKELSSTLNKLEHLKAPKEIVLSLKSIIKEVDKTFEKVQHKEQQHSPESVKAFVKQQRSVETPAKSKEQGRER
jgi:hypothetical protein